MFRIIYLPTAEMVRIPSNSKLPPNQFYSKADADEFMKNVRCHMSKLAGYTPYFTIYKNAPTPLVPNCQLEVVEYPNV